MNKCNNEYTRKVSVLFFLYFILFIMILTPFSSIAQDSVKTFKWWYNSGRGVGTKGFHVGANYNFSIRKQYYQVGYNLGEYNLFGNTLHLLNFGIGKRIIKRYFLLAGFIGPAYVWATENYFNNRSIFMYSTIGLVSNLQLIFKPIKFLGVGIELYGNANFKQSTGGIRISFHISNNK